MRSSLLAAAAVALLAPLPLSAQAIIRPDGVKASGPVSVSVNLGDITNGSGLSPNYVSGSTTFNTYVATAAHTGGNGGGFTPVAGAPTYNFRFDQRYTFDGVALWASNSNTSVQSYSLYSYADSDFAGPATLIGNNFTGAASGSTRAAVETFSPIETQYIQLRDTSNAGIGGLASASSIGEIAFRQAAPEPATWSLMILGFGAVGTTLRRQRRRRVGAIAAA